MPKAITILSGGLDSTVLAYYLKKEGFEQKFVSFNYGQKHMRELKFAADTATTLECDHMLVDVEDLGYHLHSALTNLGATIPEGHYAAANMSQTVVPNRNAIMLSIAWGIACSDRADIVAYGAHTGDHAIYPDCRPDFVHMLAQALALGTIGSRKLSLWIEAPFLSKTKADLVKLGHELGVPFENTWSCYQGKDVACGTCGTCCERLQAFDMNALQDPLLYQDRTSWREFVREHENRARKD